MQTLLSSSAGSTDTSLWTHYKAGERDYCGNKLPENMRKNDKLEEAIITPTTKAADHDVPISPQEILSQGILLEKDWHQVRSLPTSAMQLYLPLLIAPAKHDVTAASKEPFQLLCNVFAHDQGQAGCMRQGPHNGCWKGTLQAKTSALC